VGPKGRSRNQSRGSGEWPYPKRLRLALQNGYSFGNRQTESLFPRPLATSLLRLGVDREAPVPFLASLCPPGRRGTPLVLKDFFFRAAVQAKYGPAVLATFRRSAPELYGQLHGRPKSQRVPALSARPGLGNPGGPRFTKPATELPWACHQDVVYRPNGALPPNPCSANPVSAWIARKCGSPRASPEFHILGFRENVRPGQSAGTLLPVADGSSSPLRSGGWGGPGFSRKSIGDRVVIEQAANHLASSPFRMMRFMEALKALG